jgi:inhibitor of KinA
VTGHPRLLPLGDCAFTVEFGRLIEPATQARVFGLAAALEAARAAGNLPGVIEWVPTFCGVTVHFDPDLADTGALASSLLSLAGEARGHHGTGRLWTVPVCFDPDCGPDLDTVATTRGLDPQEVIERFVASEFTVCMLGFLPGFPYLSGLPAELEMPRLATPRSRVPAGSVAIAGRMAAIYPWDSPGGWRLLGRTPLRLFDASRAERPALFAPGDRIRWQVVGPEALAAEGVR